MRLSLSKTQSLGPRAVAKRSCVKLLESAHAARPCLRCRRPHATPSPWRAPSTSYTSGVTRSGSTLVAPAPKARVLCRNAAAAHACAGDYSSSPEQREHSFDAPTHRCFSTPPSPRRFDWIIALSRRCCAYVNAVLGSTNTSPTAWLQECHSDDDKKKKPIV